MQAGEIGEALVVRVGVGVDPAQSETVRALDLAHRAVDVPPRHDRHREEALAGPFLDLGHRVVEDGGAQHPELRIDDVVELLAAEPDDVRVEDLRVHAHRVHHLEPGVDVVGRRMHVLDVEPEELGADDLLPVGPDHRGTARVADDVAVAHPHGPAVDLAHVREALLPATRREVRPEVVGLGEVGVDVDHLDVADDVPLELRCAHAATLLRYRVAQPRAQPPYGHLALGALEGTDGGEPGWIRTAGGPGEGAGQGRDDRIDGVPRRLEPDVIGERVGFTGALEHHRRDHHEQVQPPGADARVRPIDEHDTSGRLDEDVVAPDVEMDECLPAHRVGPPLFEGDEIVEMRG